MNRNELTEHVSALMIKQLEAGVVPWRKPWGDAGFTAPRSLSTGKNYRGINTFILNMVGAASGYTANVWTTYKQAQALEGNVRKGEKGTTVVYWKMLETRDKETGETKKVPMLKTFTVFNLDQCDGLDSHRPSLTASNDIDLTDNVFDLCGEVVRGYEFGPQIIEATQEQAYYSPSIDLVKVPDRQQFISPAAYAETLFHELVHSTGHEDRLGRFSKDSALAPFGSSDYAKEELVAELGSVMLMMDRGIVPDIPNSAAYIQGWLKALRNDQGLILSAAQAAQKAVDRIAPSAE